MILYRKYGKTIEITKTQKEPSPIRRVSSSRKNGEPLAVRRADSVRRTKRICLRRLLSAIEELGSPLFITLTFQGSASDVLFSSSALTRFQRRLSISFPNSQSLFVPELSPGGRIHFHGLLFGVSQEWGDVKKGKRTISIGRERKERVFSKLWGFGFVDLLQTDGSPRLAYYVSKYVIKASYEPFLTPLRLVRTSRGFPKPTEYRFKTESEFNYLFSRMKLRNVWEFSTYTPYLGKVSKIFYDII
ncbi:MAG: hypothetical protein WC603_02985 [Candidatus Paceibacterota bacterium]|jgi:hypothetical protein